jgi:hypothetical protein
MHREHLQSAQAGWSLLEVCASVLFGTGLLVLVLRLMVSLWMGEIRWGAAAETFAMWSNVHRVLEQDAHAAVGAGVVWNALSLTLADGTVYRYAVNGSAQLVRTRNGGGTAVLASGVRSVVPVIQGGIVTFTVTFTNGDTRTMTVCTLIGAGSSP